MVYNLNSSYYHYIKNKQTNSYIHFEKEGLTDDITFEKDSWYLAGCDNSYFHFVIEPYKFKSIEQLRKLLESFTDNEKHIQEMMNETSNPILLFAKYKL